MQDIIIEEIVEKIVEDKPPVASFVGNNVLNTILFRKQMKNFDYIVEGDDIIVTGLRQAATTIRIPLGVTKIGKYAFSLKNRNSEKFENIIIPKSVYEIEEHAFESNYFVRNIDMEDSSVLKIGKMAFYACRWLKSVKLPKCLNEIGYGAFDRGSFKQDYQMEIIVPKHTKFLDNSFDDKTIVIIGSKEDVNAYDYHNKQKWDKEIDNLKNKIETEKELFDKQLQEKFEKQKEDYINKMKLKDIKNQESEKEQEEKQNRIIEKLILEKQKLEKMSSGKKLKDSVSKNLYNSLVSSIIYKKLSRQDIVLDKPIKETLARLKKRTGYFSMGTIEFLDEEIEEAFKELSERKKN